MPARIDGYRAMASIVAKFPWLQHEAAPLRMAQPRAVRYFVRSRGVTPSGNPHAPHVRPCRTSHTASEVRHGSHPTHAAPNSISDLPLWFGCSRLEEPYAARCFHLVIHESVARDRVRHRRRAPGALRFVEMLDDDRFAWW